MATKTDVRYRLSFGSKLRILLRFLAITSVLVVAFGALMVAPLWKDRPLDTPDQWLITAEESVNGQLGGTSQIATYMLAIGLGIILFTLLIELLSGLVATAGSRSILSINSTIQLILAVGVLIAINVYSFQHYKRWDLTRDKQFTLPAEIVTELQKLNTETTIVVLQQHKSFSQLATQADQFDFAAEQIVVEKVKDLVDLFREIGPKFQVITLDVKAKHFDKQLNQLEKENPALAQAVRSAQGNSIFFYANDKVQQVSFNEFYDLNKVTSKLQENLILEPQGIDHFTNRVLAIEEKKPKVALCVVHDLLTSRPNDYDYYTHAGLRKSLEANGFEVVDIILKKWDQNIEPAAYSPDEYRLEESGEELSEILAALRETEAEKKDLREYQKLLQNPSKDFLEQFQRKFGREFTPEVKKRQLETIDEELKRLDERVAELEKDRLKKQADLRSLEQNDRVQEDRRITNVQSKLSRILDECDLLIVPRNTWLNIPERASITARAHALTDSGDQDLPGNALAKQVEVMRAFMMRGKPVLACLGPNNEFPFRGPQTRPLPAGYDSRTGVLNRPLDGFERLLAECGVELSRQIVLFNEEQKSFTAARTRESFGGGTRVNIPPVQFLPEAKDLKPNPIGEAMKFTSQSVAQPLDIKLRHPRPVYLAPGLTEKLGLVGEFMYTSKESWNEEQPFGSIRLVDQSTGILEPPRFDATRVNDPKKGTRDEERRGPFPIGVAFETKVPIEWYSDKYKDKYRAGGKDWDTLSFSETKALGCLPGLFGQSDLLISPAVTLVASEENQKFRLAVYGQGGIFTGRQIAPATEKLLLFTCNWLLGREEKLPRTDLKEWSYPRVALSESERFYWRWGTFLGMPLVCAYLGTLMLLFRRVR